MTKTKESPRRLEKGENGGRIRTLLAINDLLKQAEADGLEINIILPRVLQVAIQELDAQRGSIIVIDADTNPEYIWEIDEDQQKHNTTPYLDTVLEDGLAGWVIRNRKPAVINDTLNDDRWLTLSQGQAKNQNAYSVISAPLMTRTRPIGVITIRKPGIGLFDTFDLNLLIAIASQAAITIENARLYEESRRQAAELSALVESTAKISRSLDIDHVVNIVAEQMSKLVNAESCAISRWNRDNDTITLWAEFHQKPVQVNDYWYKPVSLKDYPLTKKVLLQGQHIEIHPGDPEIPESEYTWLAQVGHNTLLMLPLMNQDGAIGLVELMDTRHRVFSPQEITLAQLLANQAGTTIENASLYREKEHQLRVSNMLHKASQVINSSLDLNQIMQSLLAQMNDLLNVDALSIALVDKQTQELVYEVAEGSGSEKIIGLRMPSNEGISGWVMEHGQPALVNDPYSDTRFSGHGDDRTGISTKALICAPLLLKGEVLGTIQAINPIEGSFSQNDLRLIVNLANLASSAIANAQQFARTQAAEERYLGLFEDSIDPIIITDNDGKIVEINNPACIFLEYDRGQLLGLSLKSLHPEVDQNLDQRFLEELGPSGIRVFTSQILTQNKNKIPVQVYGKRISTGEHDLLQWIHRDISKQVELEKMREDLMAMLFHDLQNPLGNILASLELLNYELSPDSDPVIFNIVEIANRSSKRLQTLVYSLLDISRLEAGHPISNRKLVDIRPLVKEAEEMVRPSLERRAIQLNVNYSPVLPQLYVDGDMIGRVIINLLDNALKFSPDEKTITLDARYQPDGNQVLFTISDQGIGIPEQYRQTVFEKFQRVQSKDSPKGLGLGLSFCRLAVEAHGGRIWADEAEGGGARFNFILPISTEKPE